MASLDRLLFGCWRRLPVLLQTEAAECGIACLAMVASYHGHHVDVATLRRRFAVSMHGTTLAALIGFAHRLDLETRAVRLELEDLHGLQLPCVLHWNFTHFVVLKRVGVRAIAIHDPSRGERSVALAEVAESFTGAALELWPTPRFERQPPAPPVRLRRLVGPITGLAGSLALVIGLTTILEAFTIVNPLLLQWVIDDVHSQFIEAVAKGRNLPEADVKAIADGRIFTGRQALQLKLVDQLGDLEDSILVAAELAGIKGKPKVVKREKKVQFLEYFKDETAAWFSDIITRSLDRGKLSLQYRY